MKTVGYPKEREAGRKGSKGDKLPVPDFVDANLQTHFPI
jgi:hypothetical protein